MYEKEAREALDLTADIIEKTGPRLVGSEGGKKGAALLGQKAAQICNDVKLENFSVHPGAFLGFIKVIIVLYAAAVPLFVFCPWASTALLSIGVLILVWEFFLYGEPIDVFFPKKEGTNITGVIEPRGEAKRQVIVSGHHDSALIFNFFVDRPELYGKRVFGGIGTVIVFWLASFFIAAFAHGRVLFGFALLACLGLLLVLPLWNFANKEGTPGAGDNLAASAVALKIAEHFRGLRDAGTGLESTRLVFVSFDGEEAGLRGARAWAKAHRADVAKLPTYGYNMDCIYDPDNLMLLLSDINGSVHLDEDVANLIVGLGEKEGIKVKAQPIAFLTGGTDAAELARAGVHETSLMGMAWSNDSRASAYHTPADTIDKINPAATEAAIRLGVRFVEALDSGALDGGKA